MSHIQVKTEPKGLIAWRETQRQLWCERDLIWTRRLQRKVQASAAEALLVWASRCGDGPLWYGLMLLLPIVAGAEGWECVKEMTLIGVINMTLYFGLKHWIGRARPFAQYPDIRACARAPDQFSFPSGHTLHAVAFTLVLTYHFPKLAAVLWPLAFLVSVSRIALGLHYPTDVVAGATIGAVVASLALLLV